MGEVGLSEADFLAPDHIVQLGYPPYRIDILTAIDGVAFDDAWERRLTISAGDGELQVIGRDRRCLLVAWSRVRMPARVERAPVG